MNVVDTVMRFNRRYKSKAQMCEINPNNHHELPPDLPELKTTMNLVEPVAKITPLTERLRREAMHSAHLLTKSKIKRTGLSSKEKK